MSDKEKVQQILTKYTISELVEYHIEAVDRINKAIEYINFEWQEIMGNKDYSNHLWTIDGLVIKRLLDILRGEE